MARKIRPAITPGAVIKPPANSPGKSYSRGNVAAPRSQADITKTLRRVLKRARKAETAADVCPTSAEIHAVREKLIPAAIAHARANERRLPAFAVLCGCRVFVRTTVYGAVVVQPDRDGVSLAMSGAIQI